MLEKLRPFALWPAIIWGVILAFLMLLPQDAFPESKLLSYDKLAHIAVFALLSVLVATGFLLKSNNQEYKTIHRTKTLTICVVYGLVLEILQQFVPGRMSDIYDLLANLIGVLLGVIVFTFFIKNKLAIHKLIL